MNIQKDYPLLPHNTFGMDVKASLFIEYTSVDELKEILRRYPLEEGRWLHIGGGSNLLFKGDYSGTILHSAIKGYEMLEENEQEVIVRVGAGEVWDDFVAYTVDKGWYGAENLSLIPGEVGASAVQNIGAYGVEAKDLIVKVETIEVATGEERIFTNAECAYAYRESAFKLSLKGQYIVTKVSYRLKKTPCYHLDYGNVRAELEKSGIALTLSNVREGIIKIREGKLPDPKVQGNAGSFLAAVEDQARGVIFIRTGAAEAVCLADLSQCQICQLLTHSNFSNTRRFGGCLGRCLSRFFRRRFGGFLSGLFCGHLGRCLGGHFCVSRFCHGDIHLFGFTGVQQQDYQQKCQQNHKENRNEGTSPAPFTGVIACFLGGHSGISFLSSPNNRR